MKRLIVLLAALALSGCVSDPLKPTPAPLRHEPPQRLPVGANGSWAYPANAVVTRVDARGNYLDRERPWDDRRRYRPKFVRSGSGR